MTKSGLFRHMINIHDIRLVPPDTCECGFKAFKSQSLSAHYKCCLIHRKGIPCPPSGYKGVKSKFKGKSLEEIVGNDHAKKIKDVISKKALARPGNKHTDESKRKISLARIKFLEGSNHIKWFSVGNIKVQGEWEYKIAKQCLDDGFDIKRIKVKYNNYQNYTPDIYLPILDVYLEIKGWMPERDKIKYKKVIKDNPYKVFKVILGKKAWKNFSPSEILNLPDLVDAI